MKKMAKAASLLLALCILMAIPFSSVASSPAPQTLTFLVHKDFAIAGMEALVEEIEKRFNIKTEFEIRVGGNEGNNVVSTRLASGDMADMFIYNVGALLEAIDPANYAMPLTNEAFASRLDSNFVQSASVNGELYAIPSGTAMGGGILYNKKLYAELGLEVPHTWDEFMANVKAVDEAGKIGMIGAYKDEWTSQFVFLADEYNVVQKEPDFPARFTANQAKFATTPVALRSFEKLAEAGQYLNSDHMATTHPVALEMLATGQGAHYAALTSSLQIVQTNTPELIDDIGFFGIPGDDPNNHGMSVWMMNGIIINKNTEKMDAIRTWIDFYMSQEGTEIYYSKIKPGGPLVVNGVELTGYVYPAVQDMQAYQAAGKSALALEFVSPLKGANAPQICVSVGTGLFTALEGAQQYDADCEKRAVQLNLAGW